jgi:hypothetical protein
VGAAVGSTGVGMVVGVVGAAVAGVVVAGFVVAGATVAGAGASTVASESFAQLASMTTAATTSTVRIIGPVSQVGCGAVWREGGVTSVSCPSRPGPATG